MTRVFGHYVPTEIMLLWMTELTVCFLLGYATLDAVASADVTLAGDAHGVAYLAAVLAVSAVLTSFAIGLYRPETFLRLRRLLAKTAVAGILSFPAIWVIGRVVGIDFGLLLGHGAWLPLRILAVWLTLILTIRLAFSYSLRMHLFTRRVVLIGDNADVARTANAIGQLHNGLFEVAGTLDPQPDEAAELLRQLRHRGVWGVVVTARDERGLAVQQALHRHTSGVRVWDDRGFWEGQLQRVNIDQLADSVQMIRAAAGSGRWEARVRRISDIGLSLVLLVFTLPLMLLTALAIRIDSKGSVFYCQERVGLHGKPFVLCKFRSMRTDAEATGPVWAAQADSRVTRIGAFIRRTRIDELPQLMNVLAGEMSFIGPRPERPHFVEKLSGVIPYYGERSHVKPGLTGWAQVNYPYGASVADARMKLSFDLYYVKRHSLFLDVIILFATIRVILFQEGSR